LDAVTGRYVQGAGATENGGVRREAKNIFVIVNSRTPNIGTKQNRQIKKNNNRKKESYTNFKVNKGNCVARFSFVPINEGGGLNSFFLPLVMDMTATGFALTVSRLPLQRALGNLLAAKASLHI
jgi:hypothetical protein